MATIAVSAQTQPGQQTTFRAIAEGVQTAVIARDAKGQFVPDLKKSEFKVFEDGVEQAITVFQPIIGGRALQAEAAPVTRMTEGLIMPAARPPADTSGRIFIIFIDDLHLQAMDTPRVRNVLGQIRDELIHEGDLVGIVSSGYSSIAIDLNYDYNHVRFNEAIGKVMGGGQTAAEIASSPETAQGPQGIRYQAHVAFSLAYELLDTASQISNRRKSFIYVSSGYSFNPFKDARYKRAQELYAIPEQFAAGRDRNGPAPYENPFEKQGQQFAESDLIAEIAELTRAARRANVTFYTIDPRGLNAGPDIGSNLSAEEWRDYVMTTVSSLQVLGEETGGFCICNTNNFKQGLQRIDAETSDYYMIGYNSNNPDPMKVRRKIEIAVDRPDVSLIYRSEYTLKRPPRK
ncbi:MAG TPA: VWA domain-containing protein [Vicinamibacterales bacterium]|nr:VWA domain-containing protein [Vicinamibacterales bacterium]